MKRLVTALLVLLTAHTALQAAPMVCDLRGNIWDIDLAAGTLSNKRVAAAGLYVTDLLRVGDTYYTMTAHASVDGNSLGVVDTATAQVTSLGDSGVSGIFEGDLAYNAADGYVYGVSQYIGSTRNLFKVTIGGQATTIGALPGSTDYSGLAFDGMGRLWALDNWGQKLLQLDPATGSVLATVNSTFPGSMGDTVGMDYDPATDTMYVVAGMSSALYTVNTATGEFTYVGSTGLPFMGGAVGLVVPEPASASLLVAGAAMAIRRRRRRRACRY